MSDYVTSDHHATSSGSPFLPRCCRILLTVWCLAKYQLADALHLRCEGEEISLKALCPTVAHNFFVLSRINEHLIVNKWLSYLYLFIRQLLCRSPRLWSSEGFVIGIWREFLGENPLREGGNPAELRGREGGRMLLGLVSARKGGRECSFRWREMEEKAPWNSIRPLSS